MPCTVTEEEMRYYERQKNKVEFGKAATDAKILEEVACAACRMLFDAGLLVKAPGLVQMWAESHREKDEKAGRPW